MPSVDLVVRTALARSSRVQQLEAMFDVPGKEASQLEWHGEVPLDDKPWNVGLIVGPSGCGKSVIMRELFSMGRVHQWDNDSAVIDGFDASMSIEDVTKICQAVGFNTIPAWLRPYRVLSVGEQFRVNLARSLSEDDDPIIVDEFTSVVDRQVAKIGSHAVQKYVRRNKRQFVGASCHYDVVDWLQPDWTLEPATMTFTWRCLQQRPRMAGRISQVNYGYWKQFSRFHYLTATLHRGARCTGDICWRVEQTTSTSQRRHGIIESCHAARLSGHGTGDDSVRRTRRTLQGGWQTIPHVPCPSVVHSVVLAL